MMHFLSRLSIARKLGLLTFITGAGILGVAMIFLVSERKLILEERSNAVKHAVDLATDVASRYQQLAAAGTLSEAQAKSA